MIIVWVSSCFRGENPVLGSELLSLSRAPPFMGFQSWVFFFDKWAIL